MRRSFLPLVLAVVVAACGGGGGGTAPTPVNFQDFWAGTVEITQHAVVEGLDETIILKGPVYWTKDKDQLSLSAGAVTYSLVRGPGSLTITDTGTLGSCKLQGQGETYLPLPSISEASLELMPDGSYRGYIRSKATYSTTMTCPGYTERREDDEFYFSFNMEGKVADNRISNKKELGELGGNQWTYSWNFW